MDLFEGEIQWTMADVKTVAGRLLTSNKIASMARNFSCQTWNVLCSAYILPTSYTMTVGDSAAFTAGYSGCISYNVGDCFGSGGGTVYPNYGWGWNGGVDATGCGGGSTCIATATSAPGGSVSVDVYTSYCRFPASAQVTVQVPTSISVVSGVLAGSTTQCSSSDFGAKAEITYQVRDQNGGQIRTSGMQPQEIIIDFIINGVPQPDPAPNWANLGDPSDSNGQFKDTPLGVCAGFAVTETATQKISVLYKGNRYPASGTLKTNSLRFTGLTAGHGRVCNGTDSSCTGADFDVSR
jgi:hypothetical protein